MTLKRQTVSLLLVFGVLIVAGALSINHQVSARDA